MQPNYGGSAPAPMATPVPAHPPRTGMSSILGIAAIALAVVAVVVAFAVPGPVGPAGTAGTNGTNGTNGANGAAGATGSQGPTGPAGNGTLMVSNATGAVFTVIGTACTNSGLSITITVPTNGNISVQGSTRMRIGHTAGTEDRWLVAIGESATSCPVVAWSWLDSIEADAPTQASVWVSAYTQNVFPVTAGTHTYYLNGYMILGQDSTDVFICANMVAVFYPG